MKKSYIYIFLIPILLVMLLPLLRENDKTFKIDGVKYAVSVDGEETNSFPAKGSYDVLAQCIGADVEWDYENWVAKIYNVRNTVSCNISFTSVTKKNYLNTRIRNSTVINYLGDGRVVKENGWRYEGADPNNYIRFNNELWRIIGVFDSSSHGQEGEYLTKIIKNEPIGAYAWNRTANNNWPNSSLYKILNNYYYTSLNGTDSGYCYKYSDVTGNCDFTNSGINSTYRPMVKNVTWYLGGGYSSSSNGLGNATQYYTYERSTDDTYYHPNNISSKTTTGYIGLMYVSDYGYSVLASTQCNRNQMVENYNWQACAGSSWLYGFGTENTITPIYEDTCCRYTINMGGGVNGSMQTTHGYATRPVLYLDSSVYILSGDGSETNPYIISM